MNGLVPPGFILGIGIDLVDIRRIEKTFAKYGDRFRDRLFTADEQAFCEKKPDRFAAYARHYAVKEACCKALGTGMRMGVAWRGMAIRREPGRKPYLEVTGGAKARLEAITPDGYRAELHVSITDEPPYASAFVTISAVPLSL